VYAKYRRVGIAQTERERELLRTANWEAFTRHYNEQVPTIEEEFDIWGPYHQYRHEMRYDLVAAAVRRHLPVGGAVLDVGCGSALVADRITDLAADYVGLDFGGHHITYAAKKYLDADVALRTTWCRGDAEALPFADASFDVVVMSEVIEHLLRPERAVWEISRLLKPGGVWIMTTNNASEVPLRSPLTHLFAWIEKGLGVDHGGVISLRPWIWPWRVDPALLPDGAPDVYLPHTHHIFGESRIMFEAAGLDPFHFSTFAFPPAQAAISQRLDKMGDAGKRLVDGIEALCQAIPGVRRLGAHMLVYARKTRDPVAATPPQGIWPGPFSA
jgi:ubiquinone/menaquinone biosynthesis C-methylase UbiE